MAVVEGRDPRGHGAQPGEVHLGARLEAGRGDQLSLGEAGLAGDVQRPDQDARARGLGGGRGLATLDPDVGDGLRLSGRGGYLLKLGPAGRRLCERARSSRQQGGCQH